MHNEREDALPIARSWYNTYMEVLGIHDISCMGKAGLNVVMPIFSRFGHSLLPLPTCSLSSITAGFGDWEKTDLTDQMYKTAKHIKRFGKKLDFIYSGYLSSPKQADIVLEIVRDNPQATYLCDPVLGDDGELYSSFDNEMVDAMRELCKSAHMITPNYTESELLGDLDSLCKCWAITSYPNKLGKNIDVLCSLEGQEYLIEGDYKPVLVNGAGDSFASFMMCYGIEGNSFFESCELAMKAVKKIIGGDKLLLEEHLCFVNKT